MKKVLLTLLAATTSCIAATTFEISAKFADVPAGTEVPSKPELLAKAKGVNVLSSPRVITGLDEAATIEVAQSLSAPDGSDVPLGVMLSITPSLTPKGNIAFRGKATDRFKHGQRDGESLTVLTCVAREIYFKGWTPSGTTVVLGGGPSTSAATKKEGATPTKGRELVIYLTFKKITTENVRKTAPTKKKVTPSTSAKKKK